MQLQKPPPIQPTISELNAIESAYPPDAQAINAVKIIVVPMAEYLYRSIRHPSCAKIR